jgi:predicted nucleotide-binding protein (sugar kinase/HSP70/actin superfamily)
MSLLDKLIVNLRIISKIQENGKISTMTPGQITLEDESLMASLWRTLLGDSREKTVIFLTQLMNDISEISDSILSSKYILTYDPANIYQVNIRNKHVDQLINLSRQLQNSKKGFVNLHSTYKSDASIASKLEEIMDKIDAQIITIERSLTMLKEQDIQLNKDVNTGEGNGSGSRNLF